MLIIILISLLFTNEVNGGIYSDDQSRSSEPTYTKRQTRYFFNG